MPHRYSDRVIIRVTAGLILNILTGGLGTMLNFNYIYKLAFKDKKDFFNLFFGYIIFSAGFEFGGIVCFAGTLFCIFNPDIVSKACKIAFPICYSVSILLVIITAKENNESNIGSCPTKKKPYNKIEEYQIIKISN